MKSFNYIRTSSTVLSAILIFQTVMIPVAHAENQAADLPPQVSDFNSKAAPVLAAVDSEGWTVVDANQAKISATDLLNPALVASTHEITLVAPSTIDDLKVTISRELSGGKFIQKFVAMNLAGKVLGRRSFKISDQEKDAAKVKLLYEQTLQNLEQEVDFNKSSDVGFIQNFRSKLAAVFGIQKAHASAATFTFRTIEVVAFVSAAVGLVGALATIFGAVKQGSRPAELAACLLLVGTMVGVAADVFGNMAEFSERKAQQEEQLKKNPG